MKFVGRLPGKTFAFSNKKQWNGLSRITDPGNEQFQIHYLKYIEIEQQNNKSGIAGMNKCYTRREKKNYKNKIQNKIPYISGVYLLRVLRGVIREVL